jgi:hypothetical protein
MNQNAFKLLSANKTSMGRLGIYLPDEVEKRLKDYVYKKTGQFRGQSEVAVEAIKEYLDRHEAELEKSENPCEALA